MCITINTDIDDIVEINGVSAQVVSNTTMMIHGYRLRKITAVVTMKRKQKTIDRFFCLKEDKGIKLPRYIREGAKGSGYKTYNSFFASLGYYNSSFEPTEMKGNQPQRGYIL